MSEPFKGSHLTRSMTRIPWRDFERLAKTFFEAELSTKLLEHMPLCLKTGESHKFDLVSRDEQIVIECKSHTWTKSGNYPGAKVTDAQRAIDLLHKLETARKVVVFQDDFFHGKSLVEVFVRRNTALLAGIEVWRYIDGKFENFATFLKSSEKGKSQYVDQVAELLLSTHAEAKKSTVGIPVSHVAADLNLTESDLTRIAPDACERLRKAGMEARFYDGYFWVGL